MARIGSSGTGGAGLTGVPPTTINAIAIWANTIGTIIQNSLAIIQGGGAIEAPGFITKNQVTTLIQVNSGETWVTPGFELTSTGSVILADDGNIVIV